MHEPEATAITGSITSSLVLAADDPAALAQFYGALLGAQPQPGLSLWSLDRCSQNRGNPRVWRDDFRSVTDLV